MERHVHKSTYVAALVFALAPAAALAHHSFAMFDQSRTDMITGVVEEFEYRNPHAWLHVAVTDAANESHTWSFEMGSIGQLTRDGWTQGTVAIGDQIEVGFHPLKDGSNGGQFRYLTHEDGRVLCQGGAGNGPACDVEDYLPATN
ncbi:MAG: hypothetical protein RJB62_1583 [Pseudomonadota bacterium]